jgi:catechol 2,3-dioxygenase-like lactoylglutathione lyase family enzyme
MSEQFLGASPILPVADVEATAHFFSEKLGFETVGLWHEPNYGVVRRGQTVIEFGSGRKEFAGSGVCFIHVENADQVHEEWQAQDIEFVGDLSDRDYGSRDFRIRDNNGNMLIIGHPLPNQAELLRQGKVA